MLLDQAHRAGRARPLLERQLGAEPDDLLVRASERQVQESERIKQRLRRVPEGFRDHLLGDLRGARAVGMSAHAVDRDQERGVLGHRGADSILIFLAPTEQADVGVFDPQEDSIASVRLARTLYHLCGAWA